MSRIAYSYSILRYIHDVISGECLNVGVVVFAPSEGWVQIKLQHQYARLSHAFNGFYGEYYRRLFIHIENRINALMNQSLRELPFQKLPIDAKSLCSTVLPNDDSSLQFTDARDGITSNLSATLENLFERYVMRNQPHIVKDSRTNDEVWKTFKNQLIEQNVYNELRRVTIKGGSFEYDFEHAWKNEKWHPLEPVSMDAIEPETLRDRAVRWVGRTTDLKADENLGTLYLLLGPPQLEKLKVPYAKAKDLLHKMPVKHQLIEEDEAEDFAVEFSDLLKKHKSND